MVGQTKEEISMAKITIPVQTMKEMGFEVLKVGEKEYVDVSPLYLDYGHISEELQQKVNVYVEQRRREFGQKKRKTR